MKNISLIFLSIFLSINLFSQEEKSFIGVNHQYHEKDTSRTFEILFKNRDKCRDVLIKEWGIPINQEAGLINWENVFINGIENKVGIKFIDGVLLMNKYSAKFETFKNDKQKSEKLENLGPNEYRSTTIEFVGPDGNNYINSNYLEKIVIDFLENTLKNI